METLSPTPNKAKIWNRNFICVFAVNALLGFALSSTNSLVSTYAGFLGASAVIIGALTGMFYGVAFAMRPISGPVTTKFDKKKLVIFATVLGIIVNTGYALTGSIGLFIAFRVINGIQFSIIGSLAMTIAGDSLPPEKMGSGMGFYGAGGAVAMAIGPSIGIALRDFGIANGGDDLGFQLVFLFATLCFVLALIPSFMFKIEKVSKRALATTGAWYKNIVTPAAIPSAVIMMLITVGYALYNTYMIPFAENNGILSIGLFYTVFAISAIFIRPFSGRAVDKFGIFIVTMIGCVIFAASFVIIGFSHTLFPVLIAAAVASVGYSTAQPAVQAMCLQSVKKVKRPVASNTTFFGMDMGFFMGPLLGGVMFSIFGSYSSMFLLMIVPSLLAVVVLATTWPSYARKRKKMEEEEEAA